MKITKGTYVRTTEGKVSTVTVVWDEPMTPSGYVLNAMVDFYMRHARTGDLVVVGWELALALEAEGLTSTLPQIVVSESAEKRSVVVTRIISRSVALDARAENLRIEGRE